MKRFRTAMILMPLFFIGFSVVGCGEGGEDTKKEEEHTHTLEPTQRVDSTCEDEGNIEYWYCTDCDKYYSDEDGKTEITYENTLVNPTSDHYYVNDVCSRCEAKDPEVNTEASEGLAFNYLQESNSYEVTGMGTCKDEDVVIPSTYNALPVTGIARQAFYVMFDKGRHLTITIPSSVTQIADDAFFSCYGLVILMEAESKPETFGDRWNYDREYTQDLYHPVIYDYKNNTERLADDGYRYVKVDRLRYKIKDGKAEVMRQSQNRTGDLVIPQTIEYDGETYEIVGIMKHAFWYSTITSITIPATLKTIEQYAFYRAYQLKTINFKSNSTLTFIGYYAFIDCYSLGTVIIPKSVETVENNTFGNIDDEAIFYCEAPSKPVGWGDSWNADRRPVYYGFTGEEITYTFVTNAPGSIDQITSAYAITLPRPSRSDKNFAGWFVEEDFSGEYKTLGYYSPTDVTLYAKWQDKIVNHEYLVVTNDETYPFDQIGDIYTSTNRKNSSTSKLRFKLLAEASFWIKYYISSEANNDIGTITRYNADGTTKELATISGGVDWAELYQIMNEGDEIEVVYTKDSSFSSGEDCIKIEVYWVGLIVQS